MSLISEYSKSQIQRVKQAAETMNFLIINAINEVQLFQTDKLTNLINKFNILWSEGWVEMESSTNLFIDSVRNNTKIFLDNVTQSLQNTKDSIQLNVYGSFAKLTKDIKSTLTKPIGLGFRFEGGFDLLGLKILGIELELVYSIDALGKCNKFQNIYKLLEGENAIRINWKLSTGPLQYIQIHPLIKIKIERGVANGMAISLETEGKFVSHLHADVKIIGINVNTDLFLTNEGVYLNVEGIAWNLFKANLKVHATHAGNFDKLTLGVEGQFVADGDGDKSFQGSYLSALRRFTQSISDEADKRISQAQQALTETQSSFTNAQNWLESKKKDVMNANGAFDNAVQKLENAKDKLEEAKLPFQNAIDNLNKAQQTVDKLCSIKSCKNICVPGIKCKTCTAKIGFVRIPVPCCSFTNCMLTIPDLICEAANILCRAVRAAAYVALELAEILVRAPMIALDIAKAVVTGAQFVVDKSRIVLDIAVAALDIAKMGLEVAKKALDVAKGALEAVKIVVQLGFQALQFVVQYGLQSIIDVRNCGFEVQLSTHDLNVFDIHCDVNAFRLGWKTISIRINFNNLVQSMWNAAKATIEAILKSVGNIFSGKKKRELQHQTMYTLYKYLRHARDVNTSFTEKNISEDLRIISQTNGFQTSSKGDGYELRTEIFRTKCQNLKLIYDFIIGAVQSLHGISDETAATLKNATNIFTELDSMEFGFDGLSIEDLGIDSQVADTEFNISITELNKLIAEGKANLSSDEYLDNIKSFSDEAKHLLRDQTNAAENIPILNYWIVAMDNHTGDFFKTSSCALFLDCMSYAFSLLYEIYTESEVPNKLTCLDSISNLENIFLNLTANFSQSAIEINDLATELEKELHVLQSNNLFCSLPPTMNRPLLNQTLNTGQTLTIVCNATGDPNPSFMWFKDDKELEGYISMELKIPDVTEHNTGWYHCTAENIVASLTFDSAFIDITGKSYWNAFHYSLKQ